MFSPRGFGPLVVFLSLPGMGSSVVDPPKTRPLLGAMFRSFSSSILCLSYLKSSGLHNPGPLVCRSVSFSSLLYSSWPVITPSPSLVLGPPCFTSFISSPPSLSPSSNSSPPSVLWTFGGVPLEAGLPGWGLGWGVGICCSGPYSSSSSMSMALSIPITTPLRSLR